MTLAYSIETSCDETSVAIVDNNGKILNQITKNQLEHNKFGGVVPEIASRAHLQILQRIIPLCFKKAKKSLNSDCLIISHDQKDLNSENSIKISTKSVVNPSTQLIRGSALEASDEIKKHMENYSTIILMSNLAGKNGAGVGPVVSRICKQEQKNLLSFAIMPFKFEKERIFQSGIALKRIRQDSQCTIVIDNDALLDSNPDLTQNQCYDISNKAICFLQDFALLSS